MSSTRLYRNEHGIQAEVDFDPGAGWELVEDDGMEDLIGHEDLEKEDLAKAEDAPEKAEDAPSATRKVTPARRSTKTPAKA